MKINNRTKFLVLFVLTVFFVGILLYSADPDFKFNYISFILSLIVPIALMMASLVVFFVSYFLMLDKKKSSIRLRQVNAWSALAFGIMLIIWPFFLISDPYQYPKCIALDVAGHFNESGDAYATRYFLISGSIALFGAAIIAVAIARLKRWAMTWKIFGIQFGLILLAIMLGSFVYAFMTFSLTSNSCGQYDYKFNTKYEDYRNKIIKQRMDGTLH